MFGSVTSKPRGSTLGLITSAFGIRPRPWTADLSPRSWWCRFQRRTCGNDMSWGGLPARATLMRAVKFEKQVKPPADEVNSAAPLPGAGILVRTERRRNVVVACGHTRNISADREAHSDWPTSIAFSHTVIEDPFKDHADYIMSTGLIPDDSVPFPLGSYDFTAQLCYGVLSYSIASYVRHPLLFVQGETHVLTSLAHVGDGVVNIVVAQAQPRRRSLAAKIDRLRGRRTRPSALVGSASCLPTSEPLSTSEVGHGLFVLFMFQIPSRLAPFSGGRDDPCKWHELRQKNHESSLCVDCRAGKHIRQTSWVLSRCADPRQNRTPPQCGCGARTHKNPSARTAKHTLIGPPRLPSRATWRVDSRGPIDEQLEAHSQWAIQLPPLQCPLKPSRSHDRSVGGRESTQSS
ncbi:hypothetical protein BDW22DRAFT_1349135 [Trametopsis cervina]|nr:hypothetical protein BDW22DRAFT_1349135 [Trametopsis cervina]